MTRRMLGTLLVLLLIFVYVESAPGAWKWRVPGKSKGGAKNKILLKIAGKRAKLRLGANPVYISGPGEEFRIVSYAWGAYSILGYSVPQISEVFCISRVSGEGGYTVGSNFFPVGDVNGDGYKDIASVDTWQRKRLLIFSGEDGAKLGDYKLQEKKYWSGKTREILATYDHNGDGVEDFFNHTGESVLTVSGKNGEILKTLTFPMYSSRRVTSPRLYSVDDLDGDGTGDILFSAGVDMGEGIRERGIACVYFLSSVTGEVINFTTLGVKHAFDPEDRYVRSSYLKALGVIGDINGDAFPDLIVTDRSDGRPRGCSVLLSPACSV